MAGQKRTHTDEPIGRGVSCLIWQADQAVSLKKLCRGLTRRGARATLVDTAARVMVELGRGTYQVLIIQDASSRPRCDQLLQAVDRYHPDMRIWRYASQSIADDDGPLQRVEVTTHPQPQAATIRLAPRQSDDPPDTPDTPDAPARQAWPASCIVSEDELAMLLSEPAPQDADDADDVTHKDMM